MERPLAQRPAQKTTFVIISLPRSQKLQQTQNENTKTSEANEVHHNHMINVTLKVNLNYHI